MLDCLKLNLITILIFISDSPNQTIHITKPFGSPRRPRRGPSGSYCTSPWRLVMPATACRGKFVRKWRFNHKYGNTLGLL